MSETAGHISVIVRTVDRSSRLAEALESLCKQSRQDFEPVVVDMSRGASGPTVSSFRGRLPRLLHLQTEQVLPRGAALNLGIARASGGSIAILDDDNLYGPEHLESMAEGLDRTAADLVYTGVHRVTYTRDVVRVAAPAKKACK